MPKSKVQRPPLTDAQKAEILHLQSLGMSHIKIGKQTGIDGRRVHGFLTFGNPQEIKTSSAQVLNTPTITVPDSVHAVTDSMATPPPPQIPTMTPQPPTLQERPSMSEFSWQSQVPTAPANGGIPYAGQTTRIEVERIAPNPDGYLGLHQSLTRDELGRIYGSGTYTLTRYDPGRPQPLVAPNVVIGENFGPPRSPNRRGEGDRGRAWGGFRDHVEQNPQYGRPFSQGQPQNATETPSTTIKNFVETADKLLDLSGKKNAAAPNQESGLVEVTKELVRNANSQNGQPDFFKQWLMEQEKARERERKDELERRDREKKEEDARWQRIVEFESRRTEMREKEAAATHTRELERIRAEGEARHKVTEEERKTLLALEDKKREMLVENHKAEMKLLEKRLDQNEMSVQEAHETMKEEREKDREHDKLILQMQQKQIDLQMKYESEKLEILRKQSENATTEATLGGLLKDLVGKADSRIAQHLDNEQMKLLVAEAEKRGITVEAVLAGVAGNIPPGSAQPAGATLGNGHAGANGNGNGKGERKDSKEAAMSLVDKFLATPEFQEIVEEWSIHVEGQAKPVSFANTILTYMAAETRPDLKIAATTFQSFVEPRAWKRMFASIKPHLKEEALKIFETPHAEEFYEGFRAILSAALDSHYEAIVEAHQTKQETRVKVPEPVPVEKT